MGSYEAALGNAKDALYAALEGMNRGIFGMTSEKRSEIHALVELLESKNPTPEPTDKLQDKVDGCWRLVYSTISILGKKRTKLGLRDFISLGDFFQMIDVKEVSEIYREMLSSQIGNVGAVLVCCMACSMFMPEFTSFSSVYFSYVV